PLPLSGRQSPVGTLAWYPALPGASPLLPLGAHGATFLAWKTDGPVHDRSRRTAWRLWIAVVVLWPVVTGASHVVNPALFPGMGRRWLAIAAALAALAGLVVVFIRLARGGGCGGVLAPGPV